jgi:ABC-2 type transport system permease protein
MTTVWFESWAPQWLVSCIYGLSFLAHFESIVKGVFDLRDILYFALVSIFFLLASATVLESVKSR